MSDPASAPILIQIEVNAPRRMDEDDAPPYTYGDAPRGYRRPDESAPVEGKVIVNGEKAVNTALAMIETVAGRVHDTLNDLPPMTSPQGVRVEPVLQRQPEPDRQGCCADADDCTPAAIVQ
jgi:hypothetical protein